MVPVAKIHNHALVGDTRTAALITTGGEVDWMCVPRFDGDPVFGRLIDPENGGRFALTFEQAESVARRYRDGSTVVETMTKTRTGVARVVEGMVANVSGALLPQNLLVRTVECLEGRVSLDVTFDPRLGLPGRGPDRVRRAASLAGVVSEWGSLAVAVTSAPDLALEPGKTAHTQLDAGHSLTLVMSVADRSPIIWVSPHKARGLLEDTDDWWKGWSNTIAYDGPFRDAIVRSLVTLRLLTYSPSGAPVAAPTTSLPEAIGGDRNWDYRFAWPRDASLGLAAFLASGKEELAHSFMHWLLHASSVTRPRLSVLYDLHGKPAPEEREVEAAGYEGSRPVRVGNGARTQHQLDVYGWVADAAWLLDQSSHRLHGETWRALARFADFVSASWMQPDNGIWEIRGDPAHYVHSKLMAWLALDRIGRLGRGRRVKPSRAAAWKRECDAIASWIRTNGVDKERNTLVWKAGSKEVDASLLVLPVVGFEPPGSSLVQGTIDAIRADLEVEPGLLYRYRRRAEGVESDEGAFLPCSFWLVQALAYAGRTGEATKMFERLLSCSNDVGLFAEEIDPLTLDQLGNFPQAFTHATIVQAGRALQEAARAEKVAS